MTAATATRPALRAHPAAEIFPLLDGAAFAALVADIRDNGQREPVILLDGMILDGRNRARACERLGIAPLVKQWDLGGTPEAFVISMNLHRRHLNESQRAAIAARLPALGKGHVAAQRRGSKGKKDGGEISPPSYSSQQAAEMLNVDRHSVNDARTVQREGTPKEIAAVDAGGAAVSAVAKAVRARRPKPAAAKTAKGTPKDGKVPISQTGKNPERIQNLRIKAEIWGHLRDVLTHLTSLPRPAEAVAIVRAMDKAGLVPARLAPALQWLKEFENEWNKKERG